ncbi:N-acetylglucosamine-6-phosphate deacetylase [Sulfolobales archaeon HS-7]|nr:N-acetylglucosamine-6-phosphate deacetylase [Sulfolobales archaeon HS-7]
MIIKAEKIVLNTTIISGSIEFDDNGIITAVNKGSTNNGLILVPGFVDTHTHGIAGRDFSISAEDVIEDYVKHGVTTYIPTAVSLSREGLRKFCSQMASSKSNVFNLEGPYISASKRGAHALSNLRKPDIREVVECMKLSKNKLAVITVAPEIAMEVIPELIKMGIIVSIGHTDADFPVSELAYLSGATRTTHIFNAMRTFHHRDPGVIIASLLYSNFIEVIPDFFHVDQQIIKYLIQNHWRRLVAITDSISATDLGDGEYSLGDEKVFVKGGKAKLKDGTIAGSTLTMDKAFRNVLELTDLLTTSSIVSYNPAKSINLNDRGELGIGKRADLVVLDSHYTLKEVYAEGKLLFQH